MGVLLGTGRRNIGRTPQGRLILSKAGASEDGKRLAAQHADAIFTHHDTLEQAQDFLSGREATAGGTGARTGRSAHLPWRQRSSATTTRTSSASTRNRPPRSASRTPSTTSAATEHYDFARHPLDAPFPDIGDLGQNSFRSTTDAIKRSARERTSRAVVRWKPPRRARCSAARRKRWRTALQRWFDGKPPTVSSSAAVRPTPSATSSIGGARPATAWPVPPCVPGDSCASTRA
ncbi:hypothetical protein J4732_10555 [Serratia marcescens]|uniref:Uncharacterized protein n=1 Tax=Serratia marcescens TaxID=615 RepID=A0A939NP21_SERMA|nr:hypothetical protein [Serratia marcescens]